MHVLFAETQMWLRWGWNDILQGISGLRIKVLDPFLKTRASPKLLWNFLEFSVFPWLWGTYFPASNVHLQTQLPIWFSTNITTSDGVLTPAQSVLGAIQGLRVAAPDISTGTIIGVTCAILALLFLIQPFGTAKLATSFAPIVVIWLLFNGITGIYNLVLFDHTVLKAFSPSFAIQYFIRNKEEGWRALGGLLLAFTGVEAMFADLGAFSKRAIQISWLSFAFPCLLLAYIGQAAYISHDGK